MVCFKPYTLLLSLFPPLYIPDIEADISKTRISSKNIVADEFSLEFPENEMVPEAVQEVSLEVVAP